MNADPCRVSVTIKDDSFPLLHMIYVRHRGFPELWIRGDSLQEAADHLAERLGHELDGGAFGWKREGFARALADVRAFVARAN